jgi:hypothetical protein
MNSLMSARRRSSVAAASPAVRPTWPPAWLAGVVIVAALGVASLSYAAILGPQSILPGGDHMNAAAHVWARYAAAYDISLAIALVAFLAARAYRMLAGALIQGTVAEALLAVVALADHRWEQIPADMLLIAAFVTAAVKLGGYPGRRDAAAAVR